MEPGKLVFNGLDAATGRYLLPPLTDEEVGRIALHLPLDAELVERIREWTEGRKEEDPKRAPSAGVEDPADLEETGWGIIFAPSIAGETKRALRSLLDHRRDQAGDSWKEFTYVPGEHAFDFLGREGAKPGASANRHRVPYYLLLVGSPEEIPFEFQYHLDVQYAVGRIHFANPSDYRHYAEGVVASEEQTAWRAPKAAFFAVKNPDDDATRRTSEELVLPLLESLSPPKRPWDFVPYIGPQADKAQLRRLLGGDQTPALLFTASHGVRFPLEDDRQVSGQGALVCQDWPGGKTPVAEEHYFTADDLVESPRLRGLIAFHLACYSAGTPRTDSFGQEALGQPPEIAKEAFVAPLPQRLLSHPAGTALAVVGHVDRAWNTSFSWDGEGGRVQVYDDVLSLLLDGKPLGWAMESFNRYFAALAAPLHDLWERRNAGADIDVARFSRLWRATNDARNFVVFGDPAVRLAAAR